jgi:hypothetical protein
MFMEGIVRRWFVVRVGVLVRLEVCVRVEAIFTFFGGRGGDDVM